MKEEKKFPQRKSLRLKDFDYSHDAIYFLTICSHGHIPLFGSIDSNLGEMNLNNVGKMVLEELQKLSERFSFVYLYEFVIMPNHIHLILEIHKDKKSPKTTLGEIVGSFKSITTNRYIKGVKIGELEEFESRIWQKNYWEHIIKSNKSYQLISNYIINNPQNWEKDKFYK